MTTDINQWLRDNPRNSKFGAPMGACNQFDEAEDLYLQKLEMVDGVYDKSGTYWGNSVVEGPVFAAFSSTMNTVLYVRAWKRLEAKNKILQDYDVTFKK